MSKNERAFLLDIVNYNTTCVDRKKHNTMHNLYLYLINIW